MRTTVPCKARGSAASILRWGFCQQHMQCCLGYFLQKIPTQANQPKTNNKENPCNLGSFFFFFPTCISKEKDFGLFENEQILKVNCYSNTTVSQTECPQRAGKAEKTLASTRVVMPRVLISGNVLRAYQGMGSSLWFMQIYTQEFCDLRIASLFTMKSLCSYVAMPSALQNVLCAGLLVCIFIYLFAQDG